MKALRVFIPVALITAAACVALLIWWDSSRDVAVVVTGDPDATITVRIEGAVVRPGTVTLPAGARLDEAIAAVGGLADDADVTRLFLAARVGDGDDIVIPRKAASPSGGTPGADEPNVGPLNINTATAEQLDELPGVGEVLAGRIVAYREEHGPFGSVDELEDVDGIGPSLLEKLRPLITVGE